MCEPKLVSSFHVLRLKFEPINYLPHACYKPCISRPSSVDNPSNMWLKVTAVMLCITQFSPLSSSLSSCTQIFSSASYSRNHTFSNTKAILSAYVWYSRRKDNLPLHKAHLNLYAYRNQMFSFEVKLCTGQKSSHMNGYEWRLSTVPSWRKCAFFMIHHVLHWQCQWFDFETRQVIPCRQSHFIHANIYIYIYIYIWKWLKGSNVTKSKIYFYKVNYRSKFLPSSQHKDILKNGRFCILFNTNDEVSK
jgi:hypothetical protein